MYMPTTQNLSQPDIDALADLWKKGQRMAVIQSFTDCQTPDRVGSEGCNMERRMGQMVLTAKAFKAAGCKPKASSWGLTPCAYTLCLHPRPLRA